MRDRPSAESMQVIPPAIERRAAQGGPQRHVCPTLHMMIAPYADRRPTDDEYRPARSYSISTTDIAFYWPTAPDFERVVIGLGGPPPSLLVLGQVVLHGPDPDSTDHLVRCSILSKLPLGD